MEKASLEATLMALSEELDSTTKVNERIQRDLRKKDYYLAYEQAQRENLELK